MVFLPQIFTLNWYSRKLCCVYPKASNASGWVYTQHFEKQPSNLKNEAHILLRPPVSSLPLCLPNASLLLKHKRSLSAFCLYLWLYPPEIKGLFSPLPYSPPHQSTSQIQLKCLLWEAFLRPSRQVTGSIQCTSVHITATLLLTEEVDLTFNSSLCPQAQGILSKYSINSYGLNWWTKGRH